MVRRNSITFSPPPFGGVLRRLLYANAAVYLALTIWQAVSRESAGRLIGAVILEPGAVFHGQIWRLVTYAFVHLDILEILFALITLWVFGAMLQDEYGSRWLGELYFTSAVGGALGASALSYTHVLTLSPDDAGFNSWAALFGLMTVVALRMGDREMSFWNVLRMRARVLVALFFLIDVAFGVYHHFLFGVVLELCGALCGFLYVRFVPRRGMGFGLSEQMYGARNAFYRAKRRRAAKKFEVYMGKQGRQVKFDRDGKYIDPDAERKDPNDRRWMN